jgi:hypothetical protein
VLPALLLLAGVAAVTVGFLLLQGRRGVSLSGAVDSLPVFYLAALSASALGSSGWLTGFSAVLLTAAFLTPLYVKAGLNPSSTRSIRVVKAVAHLMLFAAVFRTLLDLGLNIAMVLTYGAASTAYTAAAKKINKPAAYTLSAAVSATGLYTSFTIPVTVTFDVTVIVGLLLLYVVGSMNVETLERMGEALAPVAAALITLSAAASALSFTSPPTIQQTGFAVESIPTLVALAFLTFTTTPAKQGSKILEAWLLVLGFSVAVVTPVFHEALAQLTTPITGEPVKASTARAYNTALQLLGLSLLTTILNRLLQVFTGLGKGRAGLYITYGVPALAVAMAAASAISLTPAQTLYSAAAANLLVPATTLANAGIWGLASSAVLLAISYNMGLTSIIQALTLQQLSITLMPPIVVSMAAGVWAYSMAAHTWLVQRRATKAAEE